MTKAKQMKLKPKPIKWGRHKASVKHFGTRTGFEFLFRVMILEASNSIFAAMGLRLKMVLSMKLNKERICGNEKKKNRGMIFF